MGANAEATNAVGRSPAATDAGADDRMRRRILCVSPCERPDPHLIRAAARAGAQPVLDLGNEVQTAAAALEQLAAANVDFGVRIGSLPLEPDALPVYLEAATFKGVPAYIGAFARPGSRLNLVVVAVSRGTCQPLYTLSRPA